jgi:hypothetical protein
MKNVVVNTRLSSTDAARLHELADARKVSVYEFPRYLLATQINKLTI